MSKKGGCETLFLVGESRGQTPPTGKTVLVRGASCKRVNNKSTSNLVWERECILAIAGVEREMIMRSQPSAALACCVRDCVSTELVHDFGIQGLRHMYAQGLFSLPDPWRGSGSDERVSAFCLAARPPEVVWRWYGWGWMGEGGSKKQLVRTVEKSDREKKKGSGDKTGLQGRKPNLIPLSVGLAWAMEVAGRVCVCTDAVVRGI